MHKVAIISREFYPHTNFGGMATFYENLSESLINHGVHVEIFTQGVANKMITMNNGIIINYVTLNKIFGRSLLHGNPKKCFSRFCINLGKRLKSAFLKRHKKIKFDFIEVHEHMGLGLAFKDLDVPINTTIHTPLYFILRKFPKTIPEIKRNTISKILDIENQAINASQSLIFLSNDMRNEVSKDIEINNLTSIYTMYNPCKIPDTIHYDAFKQHRLKILYFGRLEERKGVHLLPQILSIFQKQQIDFELNIAGNDSTYKGSSMLKYLEGEFLNLNINFNYFGFLDKDELGKKILENSVVIVPSLYDNSAFAAQEAMSYGRFTICSNKGGTSEYVGEYGLVFDPISRQSTDSMLEDLKKTNLLDVAMRARNFSISKFSNSLYAERYLQIIKNALD
jgi:glycosyltransferase involved in cell wall biosynthesis